ncbi:chromosome 16 C19orf85 homolog [Festucalex cinctus]
MSLLSWVEQAHECTRSDRRRPKGNLVAILEEEHNSNSARMQESVTEAGSERGAPWDLYTFVTSAAAHMMRTLQKPRKNRPSKRQVNHRRFLHNMIQRKFADIEAANRRLASALYFQEVASSAPEQSCDHLDGRKVQSEAKKHDTSSTCPPDDACHADDCEDAPPISPSLTSLLSPSSFDDSRNLTDVSESDWADIMDLFSEDDGTTQDAGRFPESDDRDQGCSCRDDDGDGPIITTPHTNEDFVAPEPTPALSSCQHKMMSLGGVAQSFWAPPLEASLRHVATPPREDQLMFTDILMDCESPECTSFNMFCYHDVYA